MDGELPGGPAVGAVGGGRLDENGRFRWRAHARQWLQADLAGWAKVVDARNAGARQGARREAQRQLTHWQADPDLAGLREPRELAKLPRAEQTECFALRDEVTAVLGRARTQ